MITKKNTIIPFASASLFAILAACDSGGGASGSSENESQEQLASYLTSEEIQSDMGNLAEFAYYAEYFKAAPIYMMASDEGLYTRQVDSAEFNEYFENIAKFSEKQKEYDAAWARIDSMQALTIETPQALMKNSVGLFYSFYEFCNSLYNTGAEMREKTMARIAQLTNRDREILFDGLPNSLKKGESNYSEWWKKFNNGTYDKSSAQIYNNFMHNAESSFMDEAEPIAKIVANKGKELVEKGAAFETEMLKTALPGPVTDVMEKIETAEKINTIVTKGKDMTPEELKNHILSLIDGYDDVDKVVKMIEGYVEDKSINASNNTEKGASILELLISASSAVSEVVSVAVNAKTGKATIALGQDENGKVKIILKEEGNHLVSVISEKGDKNTQKVDVKAGQTHTLSAEINEKKIRDSLVKSSSSKAKAIKSSSSKSKSSSSAKSSSSSQKSSSSKSSSSVATNKNAKSVVGKWEVTGETISHKITDKEKCYKKWGSDDPELDFSKEECVDNDTESNYSVGQKYIFYSDGTADFIFTVGNGSLESSFNYTFNKSSGKFTFTNIEKKKVTGYVTSNGDKMFLEYTDTIEYAEITYKHRLKKLSSDVE